LSSFPRRSLGLCLFLATALAPAAAQRGSPLKVIEVKERDGQILSYRHLAPSTEVQLQGTRLAPDAKINLKIGSRPGFVELDINRGAIRHLKRAEQYGKDFLTYVLWAVSIDGRAANLGEINFDGDNAVGINVTTPYQTFWLMVTAEPDYAVVEPSTHVVLYSMGQSTVTEAAENKAMPIPGELFYFTHYSGYDSSRGSSPANVPNQLLQARKAVELASRSAAKAERGHKESEYTQAALKQAREYLARAEAAYQKDAKGREVIQFARTAAQTAESARALALGAVGGVRVHELENEVAQLREQLAKLGKEPVKLKDYSVSVDSESLAKDKPAEPAAAPERFAEFKKPTLWVAILGWAVALILLFRRRSF
jgi:hypothetical protein